MPSVHESSTLWKSLCNLGTLQTADTETKHFQYWRHLHWWRLLYIAGQRGKAYSLRTWRALAVWWYGRKKRKNQQQGFTRWEWRPLSPPPPIQNVSPVVYSNHLCFVFHFVLVKSKPQLLSVMLPHGGARRSRKQYSLGKLLSVRQPAGFGQRSTISLSRKGGQWAFLSKWPL